MNERINTLLFWLFEHTPEKLHKHFPRWAIRRVGNVADQRKKDMQQEITRLKWQLAQKQAEAQKLRNKD